MLQFFSSFPPPLISPTSPPFPRARSTLLSRVIHCSLKNSQRISRLPPRFLASGGPSSCLLYRTLKILSLSRRVGARGVAIVAAIEWNGGNTEGEKERKKERREGERIKKGKDDEAALSFRRKKGPDGVIL